MKPLSKWLHFINERFNPLSYGVMLVVFVGAHYSAYRQYVGHSTNVLVIVPLAITTTLFFFRLRLFDDIKDFESDQIQHPHRPLPRGLLQPSECLRVAFISIAIELVLFSLYGRWALLSAMFATGYSLLMYKELFIRTWLRARLTTYAVTHTLIVVFISITLFTSLLNTPATQLPAHLLSFSFAGWFIFTIFEFGRKTFTSQEERSDIDSYSKIFSRFGAVTLVVVMAVIGTLLLSVGKSSATNTYYFLPTILLVATGLPYAIFNTIKLGKIYRTTTVLFIILVYATMVHIQRYVY